MTDVTVENTAVATEAPSTEVAAAPPKVESGQEKLDRTMKEVLADLQAKKKAEEGPKPEDETGSEATAGEAETPDETAEKPPTEAQKTPEQERLAARIARANRAEARSKALRNQVREEEARLEAKRNEMRQLEAKYERLKSGDPFQVMDELGIDKLDWTKRVASHGDVTDPVSAKFASLEKRLAEEQQAREQLMQQLSQREMQEKVHAQQAFVQRAQAGAQERFVNMIEENADKYPHLTSSFTKEEVVAMAMKEALKAPQYFEQFGVELDDSVIAEYLEEQAEKRSAQSSWRKKSEVLAGKAATVNAGGPGIEAKKSRTLTNAASAGSAKPTRELTQEEKEAEMIRIIKAHASKAT